MRGAGEGQVRPWRSAPGRWQQAAGPGPAVAVLSQENLRQDRESLPSAAAVIIAATPAEQNQQHDDQNDQLPRIHDLFSLGAKPEQKKTDVSEHPEAFEHVGLLVNWPPGTAELPFI